MSDVGALVSEFIEVGYEHGGSFEIAQRPEQCFALAAGISAVRVFQRRHCNFNIAFPVNGVNRAVS